MDHDCWEISDEDIAALKLPTEDPNYTPPAADLDCEKYYCQQPNLPKYFKVSMDSWGGDHGRGEFYLVKTTRKMDDKMKDMKYGPPRNPSYTRWQECTDIW